MRKFRVAALGPYPPLEYPSREDSFPLIQKHWNRYFDLVLPNRPELIVLHECCNRFPAMSLSDRLEYYREYGSACLEFFQKKAIDNHCFISFSAYRQLPDGTARNSTQLIDPEGKVIAVYDKNYPVIEETTLQGILPGKKETIVESPFGRIGFLTCFDLNFSELMERYARQTPDLLLFSSMYHGGLMQGYWAYYCRSWFVGAVANSLCSIVNPLGCEIACSTNYSPFASAEINTDFELIHLSYNREKLLQAKKKYGRNIAITEPGKLGCVLLTSEMPDQSAAEIVREFGMERLDDYFERAAGHRQTYLPAH